MEILDTPPRPVIRFGIDPTRLQIISEPYLVLTAMGYAPMVNVKILSLDTEQSMYISPKTVSHPLDSARKLNNGKLTGLCLLVSKESLDPKSKYIVRACEL